MVVGYGQSCNIPAFHNVAVHSVEERGKHSGGSRNDLYAHSGSKWTTLKGSRARPALKSSQVKKEAQLNLFRFALLLRPG